MPVGAVAMRSLGVSGDRPPRLVQPPTLVAHEIGQPDGVVEWRPGQKPVTQVEDVARATAGALEHVERFRLEHVRRREERYRIEIALHGDIMADARPAF